MSDLKDHVSQIAEAISDPEQNWCHSCECEVDPVIDDDTDPHCPDCGEMVYTISAIDWLSDCLDIEYICSGDGSYRGARILVTFGGPNIWVDTRRNVVDGHWWNDSACASFVDSLGIDDACAELWECR